MRDTSLSTKEIPFTGKLITSEDPATIGVNYQELVNMRYTRASIEGIGGHSKINTVAIPYPKVRSGIHFEKNDESHVIVEAYNDAETDSIIYQNTTSIPNTGNFSTTLLYEPLDGEGMFSDAPNGYIAYANGAETCIYGGDESDVGGFINYDPAGTFSKDQTEQVLDTLSTTSGNIATLERVTKSTVADVLLMHLENNVTDSSSSTHTVGNTAVTFSAGAAKFGSYGAVFNGTTAFLTVPDDADFDFSGADATFTIDGWFTVDSLAAVRPIYYKQTDATNYFGVFITVLGEIQVSNFHGGSEVLNSAAGFYSSVGVITAGTTHHIEVDRNEENWYIFVDGVLVGLMVDTTDLGTETGDVLIGSDGTFFFDGNIDEYRVSSTATHTENFEAPSSAYGDGFATYIYCGFILPVSGIKLYVSTANTTAATASVNYWNGTVWSPVSTFVDGTSASSKSLAQTGSMTFESTATVASLKEIKGLVLYWYRITIQEADDDIAVYHVTGEVPFQPIKDIWDGMSTHGLSFLKYTTKYEDYTTNVFETDYLASSAETYFDFAGLTAAQYIVIGFDERQLGLRFNLVGSYVNATANTVATISYWNGSDWVSVGALSDNTSKDGVSLAQAGLITWEQLADGVEFKTEFSGALEETPTLYYYKVSFDKTLSAGRLDKVSGIPAQKKISSYKFPLQAMNRLWLFSDQAGKKNSSICTAEYTTTTFNGEDSIEFEWGDGKETTAAAWIFSQYGASVYSMLVVFKKNETWVLIGNDPESWGRYKISSSIGCVSPKTVKVIEMPTDESKGVNRSSVILFQASDGIYMTDGRPPVNISNDINIFDKRLSLITEIDKSFAFVDIENNEYHWCFAQSAYADTEYVLDYSKMKWLTIDRGTPLQYGMEVKTADGATYTYGFIDDYMLRLEHGNTFDGSGITHTIHFGDIALNGDHVTIETVPIHHQLVTVSKSNTDQVIAVTHYADTKTTGTSFTLPTADSGYRIVRATLRKQVETGIFHSWKLSITTDDEVTGFEPLFFSCLFKQVRQYIKDYKED